MPDTVPEPLWYPLGMVYDEPSVTVALTAPLFSIPSIAVARSSSVAVEVARPRSAYFVLIVFLSVCIRAISVAIVV